MEDAIPYCNSICAEMGPSCAECKQVRVEKGHLVVMFTSDALIGAQRNSNAVGCKEISPGLL